MQTAHRLAAGVGTGVQRGKGTGRSPDPVPEESRGAWELEGAAARSVGAGA